MAALSLWVPNQAAAAIPEHPDSEEFRRWETIVPRPADATPSLAVWRVGKAILVDFGPVTGTELDDVSDRLDRLWRPLGRVWRTARTSETPQLRFRSGDAGGEGYRLAVSSDGASVEAADPAGRYYALVTLTQLLPASARTTEAVSVAAGVIKDLPQLTWRGLMLDSSRHFQSVETLEWILELMALHKLNRFHWHLTDDQGWRLPVRGWPLLTEVGGWRREADGKLYGGFYSQEDIRRVVAYAARRKIVIVPEIDLPGHSSAALAAYPELSASGARREVPLEWGVADGVLALGKKSVRQFTDDVLSSVVELFPGPWIHWGGDEVYRTPWMRNPESLAWMKSVKASTAEQALAAFWNELARKTIAAGKTPIGWDEIALHSPPPGTVVQWWDDPERGLAAFKAGLPVISSWKETSYLDYPEWDGDGDRAAWMPVQTLRSVASHPFWPAGTPEKSRPLLLGLEAGLWTERAVETKIGRKLFPRLALISDLAWTGIVGGAPGWPSRLSYHRQRLETWGVGMPPEVR